MCACTQRLRHAQRAREPACLQLTQPPHPAAACCCCCRAALQGQLAFRAFSYTPWPVPADAEGERLRIKVGPVADRRPRCEARARPNAATPALMHTLLLSSSRMLCLLCSSHDTLAAAAS